MAGRKRPSSPEPWRPNRRRRIWHAEQQDQPPPAGLRPASSLPLGFRLRPNLVYLEDEDSMDLDDETDSLKSSDPGIEDSLPKLRNTVGIEFEFLVVACCSGVNRPDPHPNDGRFLSNILSGWSAREPAWKYTMRNQIIDCLRDIGVVAGKTQEINYGLMRHAFDRDALEDEDELPNENDDALNTWTDQYLYDPMQNDEDNMENAVRELAESFRNHQEDNELEIHRTRVLVIEDLRSKIPQFLPDNFSSRQKEIVAFRWWSEVRGALSEARMMHEKKENLKDEPIAVKLSGTDQRYFKWNCDSDLTVGTSRIVHGDYITPIGSIPTAYVNAGVKPPHLYAWFSAELTSPVLDYDDPRTHLQVQQVCAVLREEMRIHKPMSLVGNGLHIHFGAEAGFSLLHLKRFATLWYLMEDSLYSLHTEARADPGYDYSKSIKEFSTLATELRANNRSGIPTPQDPNIAQHWTALFQQNVPQDSLQPSASEFLLGVWLLPSINELASKLNPEIGDKGNICLHTTGKLFTRPPSSEACQTIEVRMMQGTMDADHVLRWMAICQCIIQFARDASPDDFADLIRTIVAETGQEIVEMLDIRPEDIMWFQERRDDDELFFEYPDKDKVDWTDPFMPRGHGEIYV